MKLGDLVRYAGHHWVVSRYDPRRTRTAILLAADGQQVELPYDADTAGGVEVLANPGQDWPFITVPEKGGYVINTISVHGQPIAPMSGWVASDPTRSGGPVFFAPHLELKYGESLLIHYTGIKRRMATVARVDVPRDFGTVRQRMAKAEAMRPKLEAQRNAFTKLLADDLLEDD